MEPELRPAAEARAWGLPEKHPVGEREHRGFAEQLVP